MWCSSKFCDTVGIIRAWWLKRLLIILLKTKKKKKFSFVTHLKKKMSLLFYWTRYHLQLTCNFLGGNTKSWSRLARRWAHSAPHVCWVNELGRSSTGSAMGFVRRRITTLVSPPTLTKDAWSCFKKSLSGLISCLCSWLAWGRESLTEVRVRRQPGVCSSKAAEFSCFSLPRTWGPQNWIGVGPWGLTLCRPWFRDGLLSSIRYLFAHQ